MTRRTITRDMIEAALNKGWNATLTARHYGFHHKSIEAAADRFNIALPLGLSFAPPLPKPRPPVAGAEEVSDQPPKPPVFSASKDAIERALAKKTEQKRLQAMASSGNLSREGRTETAVSNWSKIRLRYGSS